MNVLISFISPRAWRGVEAVMLAFLPSVVEEGEGFCPGQRLTGGVEQQSFVQLRRGWAGTHPLPAAPSGTES